MSPTDRPLPIAEPRTAHTTSSIGALIPAAIPITVVRIFSAPPRAADCSGVKVVFINHKAKNPRKKIVLKAEPQILATR